MQSNKGKSIVITCLGFLDFVIGVCVEVVPVAELLASEVAAALRARGFGFGGVVFFVDRVAAV